MFSICSLCYVLLMSCFCCLLTVCLHFPCHYSFLVYKFQVVIVIQYSVLIVSIVQPLDLTNKAYGRDGRSYFANVGVGGGGGGGGGGGVSETSIGHFRVAFCLCFKPSPSAKSFI